MTLYPGGGFDLGSEVAKAKLERVLESPLLRHVVSTQPRVTEYLKSAYPTVLVTEILGVPENPLYFAPGAGTRSDYFGMKKGTLDVCFAAHKYTPGGVDKGYPEYLDIVRALKGAGVPVRAHVVGPFSAEDVPCPDLGDVLAFHGVMTTPELRVFFLDKDLIISPNKPDLLALGAFDGFPLATCVEAALCGVAVLASDELAQNRSFRDGRNILIERPTADAMFRRLMKLFEEPHGTRRIAQAGLKVARIHYSPSAQMTRREEILESSSRW